MNKRFEKRLIKAQNPRARKHNTKRVLKSFRLASNTEVFLSEVAEDIKKSPPAPAPWNQNPYALGYGLLDAGMSPLGFAEGLAVAALQDGVAAVKRQLRNRKHKLALKQRQTYYAAEAAVRELKRTMIEQARPAPINPCPSATELTEAYHRRRESEEWKVRFGTMMIDLEEHVRRTYVHSGNKFVGSCGGVKEWLERECPLLAKHYSTCLRYKRKLQDEIVSDSDT